MLCTASVNTGLIDPMAENVALHLLRGERYELKAALSGDPGLTPPPAPLVVFMLRRR